MGTLIIEVDARLHDVIGVGFGLEWQMIERARPDFEGWATASGGTDIIRDPMMHPAFEALGKRRRGGAPRTVLLVVPVVDRLILRRQRVSHLRKQREDIGHVAPPGASVVYIRSHPRVAVVRVDLRANKK
jgi:hypothetical protein